MTKIKEKLKDIKFKRTPEYTIIKNINDDLGVLGKFSIDWVDEETIGSILNNAEFSELKVHKGYESTFTSDAEDLSESDFINNTFYLFEMEFEKTNFWYVIFQSVNGFEEIEFKIKVAEEIKEFVSVGAINIFNYQNDRYEYVNSIYPHIS